MRPTVHQVALEMIPPVHSNPQFARPARELPWAPRHSGPDCEQYCRQSIEAAVECNAMQLAIEAMALLWHLHHRAPRHQLRLAATVTSQPTEC